jgi:hypothetical protein
MEYWITWTFIMNEPPIVVIHSSAYSEPHGRQQNLPCRKVCNLATKGDKEQKIRLKEKAYFQKSFSLMLTSNTDPEKRLPG